MNSIKVATWNIAGGRLSRSASKFDYSEENTSYFISQLQELDIDIVAFQEDHIIGKDSVVTKIAETLGYDYLYVSPSSPSHISKDHSLGTAVMSKFSFTSTSCTPLPYPSFDLVWPDGRPANRWYKNIQIVDFGSYRLVNLQLLPLGFWGYRYDTGEGLQYCQDIDKILLDIKQPCIQLGDYSGEFTNFLPSLTLNSVSPSAYLDCLDQLIATCPTNDGLIHRNDHIFASKNKFALVDSQVIKTKTDHYLCVATLEF